MKTRLPPCFAKATPDKLLPGYIAIMPGKLPLLLLLAIFGCSTLPNEPEFNNPIIPDDPNYEPPQTTITSGPAEEKVVDDHTVTFAWAGNQPEMSFAYRLNEAMWSDWSYDTTVTLAYQDEGAYRFEVKGCYPSGIEEDTAAYRNYTIDDIHGPALRLSPRYQQVTTGNTFTVEVMLEEVANVFAVKAVLAFDPAKLQVSQIEVYENARSLLKANDGTVIPFSSYDNAAGNITIEVATVTGDPPGVRGTGAIAKITFTTTGTGSSLISFATSSALRDPDNADITIAETAVAVVEMLP